MEGPPYNNNQQQAFPQPTFEYAPQQNMPQNVSYAAEYPPMNAESPHLPMEGESSDRGIGSAVKQGFLHQMPGYSQYQHAQHVAHNPVGYAQHKILSNIPGYHTYNQVQHAASNPTGYVEHKVESKIYQATSKIAGKIFHPGSN